MQKRFKSEKHNVLTEEINKITLISNDDKRMQSIDSIETYAYGTRKHLVSEKEEIKYNSIIKWYKNDYLRWCYKRKYKRTSFKLATNSWYSIQNINNWRLWIWKTNSLFDIISQQPDIDKIYLYAKDPYEAIYPFLIKK